MILDVLGWLALADAVAAALFAGLVYAGGHRAGKEVTVGGAVGLAVLLGLPAGLLYAVVWLFARLA